MRAPMPPAEPGPRAADPIDPLSAEALRWKAIRHSRDPAAFLHYLSEYGPDGAFSELAEMRLKQLEESNATPLKAAARAGRSRPEPPPARREPPPPRREPPPTMLREPQPMALEPDYDVREPAYAEFEPDYREREPVGAYRSPPPAEYRAPEQRRGGGGAIRLLFLFVLLGGGAVAAGMYFGAGQLQDAPDVASVAEASEPRSAEASADPLASSSVDDADGPATAVGGPTQAEEAQFDLPTPSSAPPAPAPTSAPDPYAREGRLSDRAAPPPVRFEVMGAAAQSPTPLLPPTAAPSNTQLASIEPAPQRPLIARGAEVIWQTRANASQFSAVYPQAARGASVAGRVQLNCAIQSDRSAACQIVGETPAGYGFGDAALRVARYYRARATLDDGTTSVGAQAALNITFRPSD
jgi:protein TonB